MLTLHGAASNIVAEARTVGVNARVGDVGVEYRSVTAIFLQARLVVLVFARAALVEKVCVVRKAGEDWRHAIRKGKGGLMGHVSFAVAICFKSTHAQSSLHS